MCRSPWVAQAVCGLRHLSPTDRRSRRAAQESVPSATMGGKIGVEAMLEIGSSPREPRRRRNLELADAEAATRIRLPDLEAGVLPAPKRGGGAGSGPRSRRRPRRRRAEPAGLQGATPSWFTGSCAPARRRESAFRRIGVHSSRHAVLAREAASMAACCRCSGIWSSTWTGNGSDASSRASSSGSPATSSTLTTAAGGSWRSCLRSRPCWHTTRSG